MITGELTGLAGKPNPDFVIVERREKVKGLLAQGLNEHEIAAKLKVGQSTISRDVKALNKESQEVIKTIEKDYYPLRFFNIINSIRHVVKKSCEIINDDTGKWTNKDKINAMKIIIDASRTNFEILINGPMALSLNELREKLEVLEEQEHKPKSYMTLPMADQNIEDLK